MIIYYNSNSISDIYDIKTINNDIKTDVIISFFDSFDIANFFSFYIFQYINKNSKQFDIKSVKGVF